jgi:hypothetical protein
MLQIHLLVTISKDSFDTMPRHQLLRPDTQEKTVMTPPIAGINPELRITGSSISFSFNEAYPSADDMSAQSDRFSRS